MKIRITFTVLTLISFLTINTQLAAQEAFGKTDKELVYAAAEDYVLGLYNVEPERIARSVDTLLTKLGYYDYDGKSYYNVPMTYQKLYDLSAKWNAKGDRANAESPKKIEIFDVLDRTASAKLTAVWGIDYMHLGKIDGKWKIVNIMWQSLPKEHEVISEPMPYEVEVLKHQEKLNADYSNKDESILSEKKRKQFIAAGGHPFFPIDKTYRVEANFEVFDDPEKIKMKTSTSRMAEYKIYGKASFTLDDKPFTLILYQSLIKYPGYEDSLFLPFTDLCSGEEAYGAGRYIDVKIPEDKSKIVIDFNKSYQPYCAYTSGYSCPIPPAENFIDHKITAGIKHLELN